MKQIIKITPKQKEFINCNAPEVLFGGAAGGGKSYAQLIDALLYALKYAGSKQLILRRTFPDLERSLILQHLAFYPQSQYTYLKTQHKGEFNNGSVIEFGYLDSENDVYRYQGAEYDVVRFDELTHFTKSMYLYLHSRVRGVNSYPKSVKGTTNPGGIGHAWVKERFIDNVPQGAEKCAFIQSRVFDNPFLMKKDPDYLIRLERLGGNEKKALLYGEWDLDEGRFFYEFSRRVHTCKPAELAKQARRFVSLDYGMDMLAALWIAVEGNGRATVYRELYEGRDNQMGKDGRGHIISEAAKRILEQSAGEKIYAYLAPPDLWSRRQETGKSAAEIFAQNGIRLTKTSNDRAAGWLAVREYLKAGSSNCAQLRIFDTCANLIRSLGALQYCKKSYADAATQPHEITHAPDALRGFCAYHVYPCTQSIRQADFLKENFNINEHRPSALGLGDSVLVV